MRLLTHNYLKSNVKGTEKGYPLTIDAATVLCEDSPIDADFVMKLIPKIEYSALLAAARQVAPICDPPLPELPEQCPQIAVEEELDESIITALHRILFDVHVMEGHLICPDTGRKFPISDGIPNMVLHEDEI
eukprot:CAMPEP_0195532464 /NCGR_PEP_ID=MMETSP0794_2-20130614/38208_1 /TAXON_ID=515487 /ORGANISM="Stephanopyxis turris, Strain CCMP 815" /LENGTH=131 /DNA_ID=CAMNT_0040664681 /DNA_START=70 /DNA_END=465 /DNA_ORIENTATION=-